MSSKIEAFLFFLPVPKGVRTRLGILVDSSVFYAFTSMGPTAFMKVRVFL